MQLFYCIVAHDEWPIAMDLKWSIRQKKTRTLLPKKAIFLLLIEFIVFRSTTHSGPIKYVFKKGIDKNRRITKFILFRSGIVRYGYALFSFHCGQQRYKKVIIEI